MPNHEAQPSIRAVIFDLGRVLVAIDDTLLVEQLFKGLNAGDTQQLARRTMADPAMVEFNSGRITPQSFYEKMRRTYNWDLTFDAFKSLWCRIFYPMDGMEELIAQLRGRVTLGLLSDTDPLHWHHIITTWPWIAGFENPTLSYQVGVMKPDPEIYRSAARNIRTPLENCLYIDDLADNIEGARAVGMHAARFETVPQLEKLLTDLGILNR